MTLDALGFLEHGRPPRDVALRALAGGQKVRQLGQRPLVARRSDGQDRLGLIGIFLDEPLLPEGSA